MEDNYKISHTAYPDGSIVSYTDGMSRPQVISMDQVMKDSIFKTIIKQGRKKTARIIRLDRAEPLTTLYAVK